MTSNDERTRRDRPQTLEARLEHENDELRKANAVLAVKNEDFYEFAPVAYFALGHGGNVEKANLTAADILGRPQAQLLGQRFETFVLSESLRTFTEFLRRIVLGATTDKEGCIVTLTKPGDIPVVAYLEAVGIPSDAQHLTLMAVDISSAQRTAD
jgi:PAS domain-containing protein